MHKFSCLAFFSTLIVVYLQAVKLELVTLLPIAKSDRVKMRSTICPGDPSFALVTTIPSDNQKGGTVSKISLQEYPSFVEPPRSFSFRINAMVVDPQCAFMYLIIPNTTHSGTLSIRKLAVSSLSVVAEFHAPLSQNAVLYNVSMFMKQDVLLIAGGPTSQSASTRLATIATVNVTTMQLLSSQFIVLPSQSPILVSALFDLGEQFIYLSTRSSATSGSCPFSLIKLSVSNMSIANTLINTDYPCAHVGAILPPNGLFTARGVVLFVNLATMKVMTPSIDTPRDWIHVMHDPYSSDVFLLDNRNSLLRVNMAQAALVSMEYTGDYEKKSATFFGYHFSASYDISTNYSYFFGTKLMTRVSTQSPPCSEGYTIVYNNVVGEVDVFTMHCESCPPGKYSELLNAFNCEDCKTGTYSVKEAASFCYPCEPGYDAPVPGAQACLPCPAGKYAPYPGTSNCLNCPAGTISSTFASVDCRECLPGSFSASAGSRRCNPCSPGSASNIRGLATQCTECPAGTYSPLPGLRNCTKCPVSQYTGNVGSINCSSCMAMRNEGSSVCPISDINFFLTVLGICTSCIVAFFGCIILFLYLFKGYFKRDISDVKSQISKHDTISSNDTNVELGKYYKMEDEMT